MHFVEEIVGETLQDIAVVDGFLDKIPKSQASKTKLNKWNYIKLRMFLHKKGKPA